MMFYEMPYRDQCNASHSGPGTLEYALVEEEGERRAHFGPIVPEAHPVVVVTTGMIMLIGDIVDECGIDRAFGHRSHELSLRLQTFAADREPRRARQDQNP
jgi:hypothetical protein